MRSVVFIAGFLGAFLKVVSGHAQNICQEDETAVLDGAEYAPYCRTKVESDPNIGVYWPQYARQIVMAPVLSTCLNSCVGGTDAAALRIELRKGMDEWNSSGGEYCSDIEMQIDTEDATVTYTNLFPNPAWPPGGQDGVNAIVWREGDESAWILPSDQYPDPSEVLALTTLKFSTVTGEIVDADMDINGVDHTWSVDEEAGGNDIRSVLTHELGHVLGFAHIQDIDSTMYPGYQSPGIIDQGTLSEGDVQGLCDVYPSGKPTPGAHIVSHGELRGGLLVGCAVQPHQLSRNGFPTYWFLMLILLGARTLLHRRAEVNVP